MSVIVYVILASCGQNEHIANDIDSCAPLTFSVHEKASYRYIYRGVQEHILDIEVAGESDRDFTILENYDLTAKYIQVNKQCSVDESRFGNAFHPEALLVLDPSAGNWGQDAMSMITEFNSRMPVRTLVALVCNEHDIATPAGMFTVDCVKTAYLENGVTTMIVTRYFHRNIDSIPFNGMVKYVVQYPDSVQGSSMELTYWNGK